MTDEQIILGLIPAKSLDCLDSEDSLLLQSYMNQGFSFPFEELGKYQYIASLLPLTLELEIPRPQLKDTVALRLIKLSEELKANKIKEEETITSNSYEEENTIINEESVVSEDFVENQSTDEITEVPTSFDLDKIELPENNTPEPFSLSDTPTEQEQESNDIQSEYQEEQLPTEETDLSQEQINYYENLYPETPEETITDVITDDELPYHPQEDESIIEEQVVSEMDSVTTPIEQIEEKRGDMVFSKSSKISDSNKKDLNEKIYLALEHDFDAIKSSVYESERRLTRNLMIAYVAIVALLALLVFSFFKFTSDINSLENKVKDLKKDSTSGLIEERNINSEIFFHS
jgi:hypothetical protein